jgi:hypothetical protein
MIKHVVLMKWKEPITDAQLATVNAAFTDMPKRVSGIVSSSFGADLSIFPGNADYMLVLDFANEDDFKNYVIHPAHAELMESVTGPLMESWSTAQIAI